MVVDVDFATTRLGRPQSTVERGTISKSECSYVRRWSWNCGCAGEIIGATLLELSCCDRHAN